MIAKKYIFMLIALATVVFLLSACGVSVGTTGSGTPQSNLTVLQVLQNSQKAMSKLKSAHVSLKANGSGQAVNSGTPTTSTPTTTQITFSVTGSGDEALPDQEEMHFTTTQSLTNTTNTYTQIIQGKKVYVQSGGQWYVLNTNNVNVNNPFAGLGTPDLNTLIGLLIHTKITDHGDQQLNGLTLRHITIALDKYALQQFLNSDKQLVTLLGQQNINAVLNNTKAFSATVDLWIDETQFYLHRTELKLNLNVDAASLSKSITPTANSGISGLIPSNVLTKLDSIADLSNFNEPVTITPPASATPITVPTTTG
jgi:hypothetical protein